MLTKYTISNFEQVSFHALFMCIQGYLSPLHPIKVNCRAESVDGMMQESRDVNSETDNGLDKEQTAHFV